MPHNAKTKGVLKKRTMEKELIEALEIIIIDSDTPEQFSDAVKVIKKALQKAKEQQGGKTSEVEANQRSVSDEEIDKLALEKYPESFCWYGSNPPRHIDDNARDRILWKKGFKYSVKWMQNKLNK